MNYLQMELNAMFHIFPTLIIQNKPDETIEQHIIIPATIRTCSWNCAYHDYSNGLLIKENICWTSENFVYPTHFHH